MKDVMEITISWRFDSSSGSRTFLCENLEGAKEYLQYLENTEDDICSYDVEQFIRVIEKCIGPHKYCGLIKEDHTYEVNIETKTIW